MAGFKTGISAIYAHARDRSYTAVYTKQGRSDMGLRSSQKLRSHESGNKGLRWEKSTRLSLHLAQPSTIHDKLLEKIRQRLVRKLNTLGSKQDYLIRLPTITHQILRHHAMAQGAGADRVSRGMSKAFGRAFSLAARVKKDQVVIQIYLPPRAQNLFKPVLQLYRGINPCIPGKTYITVSSLKKGALLHSAV